MTKNWAWLAFGASLMLNIVFIAGVAFGWSHHWGKKGHHGWDRDRGHHLLEELDLNEQQLADFQALRDRHREARKARKDDRKALREALVAELAKPTFDRPATAALLSEASAARQEGFLTMAEDFHGYLQGLTDEQREKFLEMTGKRGFLRHLMGGGWKGKHGHSKP